MDITYNRAPTAIFSLKISAMAKLIYERMYVISKEGTQVIFFKQVDYSEFFNVSRMTIFRAVNELLECKLLELAEPAKKFRLTRLNITRSMSQKLIQKISLIMSKKRLKPLTLYNVQKLYNRMYNN